MEVNEETRKKIGQLQLIEQNIHTLIGQKQQFQSNLMEIESALKEIDSSEKVFKIVGNIMAQSDKSQLQKELQSKKEMVELRIKSINKQESKSRDKANKIQQQVLQEMKSDSDETGTN